MSESLQALRHLAQYVNTQLGQFQQLKSALEMTITVTELLPDRQKQVEECEARLTQVQSRLREATNSHEQIMLNLGQQEKELQVLIQKEQRERVAAKERHEEQKLEWQHALNEKKLMLQDIDQQVKGKREELARLQDRLKATVEAALTGRK